MITTKEGTFEGPQGLVIIATAPKKSLGKKRARPRYSDFWAHSATEAAFIAAFLVRKDRSLVSVTFCGHEVLSHNHIDGGHCGLECDGVAWKKESGYI